MSDRLVSLGKRPPEMRPPASSPAPAPAPADPAARAGRAARPAPGAGAPRVYVETYGCQMNVADSDLIGSVLADAGYAVSERAEDADVVVVNTCAVREKAEERVIARAAELGALKRRRPGTVLAIVGCMAEHLKEGLVARAPAVDVIAGPDSYRRMPELLAAARAAAAPAHTASKAPTADDATDDGIPAASTVGASAHAHAGPFVDVKLDKAETYEGLSGAAGGDGVSGFVTIQRGCDKFCTFCVVPFTRGRERGAAPREVLRQVRELAEAGYREVMLLGQTVNSYVWDDVTFAQLLRAVARVDGIERIRFTSPYPVDFTDDVVAAIAEEPKVCTYVHLPVQSGSDAVLERMRRGYTVDDYRAIVARLRRAMPDIALSTDILTGFSGETDADHAADARADARDPLRQRVHVRVLRARLDVRRQEAPRRRLAGAEAAPPRRDRRAAGADQRRGVRRAGRLPRARARPRAVEARSGAAHGPHRRLQDGDLAGRRRRRRRAAST